jgi:hypothetical protein
MSACCSCVVVDWVLQGTTTYPPLSTHTVSFDPSFCPCTAQHKSQVPVKILCGHDCSLCAPPTASRVFWPGFNPLYPLTMSAVPRPMLVGMYIASLFRPACDWRIGSC